MGRRRQQPRAGCGTAEMESQLAYEKERTELIRQNKQRMEELGLLDLANGLAATLSRKAQAAKASRLTKPESSAVGPLRRSSRLKGIRVVYYKQGLNVDEVQVDRRSIKLNEGSKPEIYTAEHEKLLGDSEKPWELFVDGCDESRSRIYDSARGKTCHQCRQKTLGQRTSCSICKSALGRICGDCLYMRYGENVLETMENQKWSCPVCRGICNCSVCRPKRGWAATGPLYRKVTALGYKSVAHYLIYTRRAVDVSDEGEESGKD